MVDSVNGASFANNPVYQYHYEQWQIMKKKYGTDMSFTRYLRQLNVDFDLSMQGVENLVETGDWNKGDGIDGNTINYNRHVDGENHNKQMYQSDDMEGFYEIDWESGTYNKTGREGAAKALGLGYGFDYDTIVFGNGVAEITDFTFGNLDDGQDRNEYNLEGIYKNITYAIQEFDPCYLVDASLSNPNDPEYQKAMKNWEYLCATATQWMSASDFEELAGLDENSTEYKNKVISIILDKLDQMNAFSDHKHVEYTGDVTDPGHDGAVDGNTNGSGNSSAPNYAGTYDKSSVLSKTSLYGDYLGNKSTSCSSYDSKSKCLAEGIANFTTEAQAKLSEIGNALRNELQAKLGGAYDAAAVDAYIEKAILSTIEHFTSDIPTLSKDYGDGGNYHTRDTDFTLVYARRKNNSGRITYNNKNLIDYFLREFDSISANNGKTQEQVNADKAENEKVLDDYKKFYDFNIKSSSLSVDNIKSEYTVSMTGGNYKQDAQNNVLTPYSQKLLAAIKSQCPKLSDAQIQKVLDAAMSSTLSESGWVTANGNISTGGTYTIDTDKLLDSFAANIKAAITKVSGYEP